MGDETTETCESGPSRIWKLDLACQLKIRGIPKASGQSPSLTVAFLVWYIPICTDKTGTEDIVMWTLQSPHRKPLGQTIRIRREKLGLTQEQLAEKAGLHWTFISGVERGIRNISVVNLHRIAVSLGVRLRDLVDKC